jgi:hypothetical protein
MLLSRLRYPFRLARLADRPRGHSSPRQAPYRPAALCPIAPPRRRRGRRLPCPARPRSCAVPQARRGEWIDAPWRLRHAGKTVMEILTNMTSASHCSGNPALKVRGACRERRSKTPTRADRRPPRARRPRHWRCRPVCSSHCLPLRPWRRAASPARGSPYAGSPAPGSSRRSARHNQRSCRSGNRRRQHRRTIIQPSQRWAIAGHKGGNKLGHN